MGRPQQFPPMTLAALAVASLLATSTARSQERGNVARGVLSPEVSADHKITLRLQAPNAKAVQVAGDFSRKTLT